MDAEPDQHVAKLRDLASRLDVVVVCPPAALDAKTDAPIRVGALVALGVCPTAYLGAIRAALAVGASPDEVVGTLASVCATVGVARVVAASGGVAVALGYDIDAAFEEH